MYSPSYGNHSPVLEAMLWQFGKEFILENVNYQSIVAMQLVQVHHNVTFVDTYSHDNKIKFIEHRPDDIVITISD